MTTQDFLLALERQGLRFVPEGEQLAVEPSHLLTDELRQEIRARKPELLRLLSRPYLTIDGELRIPFTCPERYHWWRGGQSIAETLQELNAPANVWRRYVEGFTETRQ